MTDVYEFEVGGTIGPLVARGLSGAGSGPGHRPPGDRPTRPDPG